MKKLFVTNNGAIAFDTESQEVSTRSTEIISARAVYLMKEDTQVIYQVGTKKQEVYAEAGDIVVVFYNKDDFKYQIVVAKSAQWADNIDAYNEAEQKRKEEWATKHKNDCSDCESIF